MKEKTLSFIPIVFGHYSKLYYRSTIPNDTIQNLELNSDGRPNGRIKFGGSIFNILVWNPKNGLIYINSDHGAERVL